MKLRDEVKEHWGLVVPDDAVWYETDDEFVTKGGMGVRRNTEIFWRNRAESLEQTPQERPGGCGLRRPTIPVGEPVCNQRRDDSGEGD